MTYSAPYETSLSTKWELNLSSAAATVYDYYGSRNLTVGSAPTPTQLNSGAYYFLYNGTSHYHASGTGTLLNGSAWSFEFVIKYDSSNANPFFTRDVVSSTNYGWQFFINGSGHLELDSYNAGTKTVMYVSNYTFTTGTWYHLVLTYKNSGTRYNLYVNGASADTGSTNASAAVNEAKTTTVYVNRDGITTTNYGKQALALVRIWKSVTMSAANALVNYNAENWRWTDSAITAKTRILFNNPTGLIVSNQQGAGYNDLNVSTNRYATNPSTGAPLYTGVTSSDNQYNNSLPSELTNNITGAVTLEWIIYPTNIANQNNFLYAQSRDDTSAGFQIYYDTGGQLYINRPGASGSASWHPTSGGAWLQVNTFYHIQITWDFSVQTSTPVLYINNVNIPLTAGSNNASGGWGADQNYATGMGSSVGDIYLFQVWNAALNSTQLSASYNAEHWRYSAQNCTVAMTYPDTTYDDYAMVATPGCNVAMTHPDTTVDDYPITVSLISNPTVAMTYPSTTYDDYAMIATPGNFVAMTYPGTTYDDYTVGVSVTQNRTVAMPYPDTTVDDYTVTTAIEQDRTVPMTYPGSTLDDYAVGVSLISNPTVAMPYPSATYDDAPIAAAVEQDRTVAMPYPDSVYDDYAIGVSIQQDRTVAMSYPDTTYDDYSVVASVEQDRTVDMSYPDATLDDYAIGVSLISNPTVLMTCPDAVYDDYAVIAAIEQDRSVSMTYPDTTYDDYLVSVSVEQGQQSCVVAMTYPDTTYDDAPMAASAQQNRSVTMPYPDAVYDDYSMLATVSQDRTVAMPYSNTTYDDQAVAVSIGQDRIVAMTYPDSAYDDQALSAAVSQDRTVIMPYPDSVLDDYAVTVSRISNPTVLMPCPHTTFDDALVAVSITQSRAVMMPYPDTLFEPQAVGVTAGHDITVAMTYPTAEWGASEVSASIRQDRTVLMAVPTTEFDGEAVAVSLISNPTVDMPCPDMLFSSEPVEVWVLDKAHIINVEGCIATLIRLEGSRSPATVSGSRTNSTGLLGSIVNTAHLEGSEADMLEDQWIKDPPIRRGISMAIEAPIYTDDKKTTLATNLSDGTVIWRLLGDFESEMLVKTSDDPTEIAVDTPLVGWITIYLKGDESLDWPPGTFNHEAVIITDTEEPEGLFEGQAVVK